MRKLRVNVACTCIIQTANFLINETMTEITYLLLKKSKICLSVTKRFYLGLVGETETTNECYSLEFVYAKTENHRNTVSIKMNAIL